MLEPDPASDATSTPDPEGYTGTERRVAEDRRTSAGSRQLWMNQASVDLEFERMHHGTPIQCQFCTGQVFRRSRLRSADIRQLLLMRYPVRCTRCSQRQNVSFTVAGISIPSYLRQRDHPPRSWRASSRSAEERLRSRGSAPSKPNEPPRP